MTASTDQSVANGQPQAAFKDVMGRLRTQSLFQEFKDPGYPAFFTLREEDYTDQDGNTYVSLRRLYMEAEDPTEYAFAQRAFGSWRHWDRIRHLQWFRPHWEDWKAELDIRLRSAGVEALISEARAGSVPAARFLAQGEYRPKKRGRPSSEEVLGERKRMAAEQADLDEDAERIGL